MTELERLTRSRRIDPRLTAAGWKIEPYRSGQLPMTPVALTEFPTASGPADYALCLNGAVVGVVEAKKLKTGPQSVLEQAERYARGLTQGAQSLGEYRCPFLYSTNGELIWFRDVRHELSGSRRVASFHSPRALGELLERDDDAAIKKLRSFPRTHPGWPAAARSECCHRLARERHRGRLRR